MILRFSIWKPWSGESVGNVAGGDGAEELIVFAGFAGERERDGGEQLGELLRGFLLGGFLLCECGAHFFEALQIAGRGFDAELAREKEIAGVAVRDVYDLAASAELFDVFLQNDFHVRVLGAQPKICRSCAEPCPSTVSAANGSSAIFCARLMATVSQR